MQKNLKIRFSIPGFHYWPNPPKKYSYLGKPHRHMFNWVVTVPIENNRELEFIELKDRVVAELCNKYGTTKYNLLTHLDFKGKSCEAIAIETYKIITNELNIKCQSIEVSEDGENSAEIIWA